MADDWFFSFKNDTFRLRELGRRVLQNGPALSRARGGVFLAVIFSFWICANGFRTCAAAAPLAQFPSLFPCAGLCWSLVMPPRLLRELWIKTGRIPAATAAGIKNDPFDPQFPPNPRVGLFFLPRAWGRRERLFFPVGFLRRRSFQDYHHWTGVSCPFYRLHRS